MQRLAAALIAVLLAAPAFAQYTNRFAINPNSTRNIAVTHKAHNQANWLATISGVDLTDHEPIMCGVKSGKGDNTFFALSTGTVVSASAGTVLFEFPTESWVTNITENVTMYGDIRLTDFDLPLPSLIVTLKPAFNWGTEVYVSPANHEYQTNAVSIGTKRVINFDSGFTAVELGDTLTLSVEAGTAVDQMARDGVATNAANLATHEALEGTNVHGLGTASTAASADFATATQGALADSAIQTELDPTAVKLTGNQTVVGEKTFTDSTRHTKDIFLETDGMGVAFGAYASPDAFIDFDGAKLRIASMDVTANDYILLEGFDHLEFPDDMVALFGSTSDVGIRFDGSDLIINSYNATPNDEVNFTNFDAYNFDNVVRAADPVGATDLVTKQYGDANYLGGGGSGFPLTNDVSLAGFSMTNGTFGAVGDTGVFTRVYLDASSYLSTDGTNLLWSTP